MTSLDQSSLWMSRRRRVGCFRWEWEVVCALAVEEGGRRLWEVGGKEASPLSRGHWPEPSVLSLVCSIEFTGVSHSISGSKRKLRFERFPARRWRGDSSTVSSLVVGLDTTHSGICSVIFWIIFHQASIVSIISFIYRLFLFFLSGFPRAT